MAAATVSGFCAPTLLALKQAGLEYLLLDEAQTQTSRDSARATAQQPASPGARPRPEAHAPQAASCPADWPAAWRERLKKTRTAPVVWTYWELGRDLCGTPDPKRRELLQELLRDLGHPPGTHSFWPMALPAQNGDDEQELEANIPLFWEGIKLLHSRAVMIMGSQALRALALPERMRSMRPFQQARCRGVLLIVLPAPDMLIREAQRTQALREFLRQALAPFA